MHVPTLILIGEREVIYDAAAALDRARRRLPNCEGRLVLASSHDMTFSQHRIVDARILDFLGDNRRIAPERVVA
jgi:pimeloyl-ACP methyl ester carboxylesterase